MTDLWHFSDAEAAALAASVDPGHPDLAPFWAGCLQRRLVLQRCLRCERHQWPPRPVCRRCGGEPEWRAAGGRGLLFSWTVVHLSPLPAFAAHVPYVTAIGELPDADGVRLVARLDGAGAELEIGEPLHLGFQQIDDSLVVPVWSRGERPST